MLSDKQKLLIASVYIMKKQESILTESEKSIMVDDYAKSLNVDNKLGLYRDIKNFDNYFVACFSNFMLGSFNYDVLYSRLGVIEQYILVQMQMMFTQTTGVTSEQKYQFMHLIQAELDLSDVENLLKDVEEQITEIDSYMRYWKKNKNE